MAGWRAKPYAPARRSSPGRHHGLEALPERSEDEPRRLARRVAAGARPLTTASMA